MEKETGTKRLTVCDWCILVAVISLLASLAQPTFSQAVEEKKLTDLVDRLQSVRAKIQLYKVTHDGLLPGQRFAGDTVTAEQFTDAMAGSGSGREGFALRQIPINPYSESCSVTCVNDPDAKPAGTEDAAWWFNAATGDFYACDSQFHTNY